jgi:hypothetical protein
MLRPIQAIAIQTAEARCGGPIFIGSAKRPEGDKTGVAPHFGATPLVLERIEGRGRHLKRSGNTL